MVFGFGGSSASKTQQADSPVSMTPVTSDLGGSNRVQGLKQQVRQEMSVAHAQELVKQMTDQCFERCVPDPGSSLSGSQQKCATQCMGLYTQAWGVIQRSYIERVQQEQQAR